MNWNEQTALAILDLAKLPPEEELIDLIDELIFEKRGYFLQQPIIPKLYQSRVRKLLQIHEAAAFLLNKEETQLIEDTSQVQHEHTVELEALFDAQVTAIQLCRLQISNAMSIPVIVENANEMCAYQASFERIFLAIVSTMELPTAAGPLQADQIDLGKTLYKMHHSEPIDQELAKEKARILAALG